MKKLITIILFIFLIPTLHAQDSTRVYSLRDCLELGLEKNYAIRLENNRQRIANNNVTLGNAGFLPTLDGSSSYSGTYNNMDQYPVTGDKNSYNGVNNQTLNASVYLGWTVFNGFTVRTNYERLKELQHMGELDTRYTVEDFISTFTEEYYGYVRQLRRLSNLKYAVQLSGERVRIVEARYEIGAVSRLDMQQANVDLNSDRSNLMKQYEVLHNIQTRLNQLMAIHNVDISFMPADTTIVFNEGLDRQDLWETALRENIVLQIVRKEGDITRLDLKTIRGEAYPYVRVNAGYGYTGNWYDMSATSRQHTRGLNYGATVGINVFDGMNRRRRERNVRIDIENRELEYEQAELALQVQMSNAWMAYLNNMRLVDLEKDNLDTAKDNYEIAMERYKLGQLSGIELREAQNSLLEAEERLVQAQYDTKLCEISLLQISGQIVFYLE